MVVISQHNTGQLLTFNVSSSEFSDVITYDYKHVFNCQPEVSLDQIIMFIAYCLC